MADLSILDRGKVFVKQSGKMIEEQYQIAVMAQAETICHKRDMCKFIEGSLQINK